MKALFNVTKSIVLALARGREIKSTIRQICGNHSNKISRYGKIAPGDTYYNHLGDQLITASRSYRPSTHYFIIKVYRGEYYNFEKSLLNAGIIYEVLPNGIVQAERRYPDLILTGMPIIITVNDSILAELPYL